MAYIGAEPDGQGKAQRFTYTSASGGETTITADDDGIPIGYTAGQVSVYLNGVKLVVGTGKDCQATNGSTITGLSALAASDVVEIVALSTFDATTVEGTAIISTGETGGSKFLREDGDGTSSWQTVTEYNDDVVQTNIALLAFKVAVNGSLAKYNLQDQVIDEYSVNEDHANTGIDKANSTNETWTAGVYSSSSSVNTPPVHSGSDSLTFGAYTIQKFDNTASTETLTIAAAGNVDILVVGGGGSGSRSYGGGGGAGGLVYMTNHALSANTYNAVIGDGGAGGSGSAAVGNDGEDSTWSINGGSTIFTAKGGGGGGRAETDTARDGGSGGGSGYTTADGGATTQPGTAQGVTPTTNMGYAGGAGAGTSTYSTAGGGGAGGAGQDGSTSNRNGGDGGLGYDASSIFGTAVGDSGWFASGGGGEVPTVSGTCSPNAGSHPNTSYWRDNAHPGGGSAGAEWLCDSPWALAALAAQDGTGGGSGGGQNDGVGSGGSGVILVRYPTAQTWNVNNYADLTLQSLDTTAEAVPTKADMVILIEDSVGTATLNTDIKGLVSRDSGVTFTEGVLVDEGHWGDGTQRILAFHDLSFTSSTGTSMCYKITTHNQDASTQTKIHATSIGWR